MGGRRWLAASAVVMSLAACDAGSPVAAGMRHASLWAVFQVGVLGEAAAPELATASAPPAPGVAPAPSPRAAADGSARGLATPEPRRGGSGGGGSGSSGGSGGGSGGGGSSGSGGGGSSAGPGASPTPVGPGHTLEAGPGTLAGVVRDVLHGGVGVPGAAITIVSASDPAQRAVTTSRPDGIWHLTDVALGTYLVSAEKSGYAGAATPVSVILYRSSLTLVDVNFVLSAP